MDFAKNFAQAEGKSDGFSYAGDADAMMDVNVPSDPAKRDFFYKTQQMERDMIDTEKAACKVEYAKFMRLR